MAVQPFIISLEFPATMMIWVGKKISKKTQQNKTTSISKEKKIKGFIFLIHQELESQVFLKQIIKLNRNKC